MSNVKYLKLKYHFNPQSKFYNFNKIRCLRNIVKYNRISIFIDEKTFILI